MYRFEWLELLATYSLMVLMRLKFRAKIHSIWQIFGTKICCYCSFFSKRFGWICGLVLLYVKLPWNFPLRFKSLRDLCCLQPWQHSVYQLCWCVWDHLCTLLLVVIMAKVSNYSTKKIKILHKQGLHPAEILKALKCEGLLVSFSSTTCIIRKLHLTLTGSLANLPWSGRPQKLLKTKIGQRDQNTNCFSCHLLIFSVVVKCKVFHSLYFTQLFQSFDSLFPPNICLLVAIAIHPYLLLLL